MRSRAHRSLRFSSRICALFTLTEGGELDAFDTLMQVLRIPRVHFQLSDAHRAPRAPELHRALGGWLRSLDEWAPTVSYLLRGGVVGDGVALFPTLGCG